MLARWALQHDNRHDLRRNGAHKHARAGNPQLWSAVSLAEQSACGRTQGVGFHATCAKALTAAVACGAMVRWTGSGLGTLYMPVRRRAGTAARDGTH